MFIRNCLTARSELTVVHPDDSVRDVLAKMDGHLSVPCVDEDDKFTGIVSKRTIFEAFQTAFSEGIVYEEFLSHPITNCIDTSIQPLQMSHYFEETINVIVRHPFVPIVENDRLIGIVKRGDVNSALEVAFATNVEGDRLLLGLAEIEGALHQLFTITHKLGVNVITAVPFDAEVNSLNRRLILRIEKTSKLATLTSQLERAGFYVIAVNR